MFRVAVGWWAVAFFLALGVGMAQEGLDPRTVGDGLGSLPLGQGPDSETYPELPHLMRVSDRILSGGEPKTEAAFETLAALGVQVIISVDGARPRVATATRHGLRYVHVPIGYDGVSHAAGLTLARAMRELAGPFYVHCHHGKHRGPAAAAIASVADGGDPGDAALEILERAGTNVGYAGLWRDVSAFRAPGPDGAAPELVAVAEVGSMALAMAAIDRAYDHLKLCQDAGWTTPPDHPDLVPAQQALLLKEGLVESARHLSEGFDDLFLQWMRESAAMATRLEGALEAAEHQVASEALVDLKASCARCHDAYRN